jgi:hypothetical protein
MQNKIVFFLSIVSFLILYVSPAYQLGGYCKDKYILDEHSRLTHDVYEDHKEAFNGIASCVSLRSTIDTACCYMKVKFKNEAADKKYTHRGCIELYGEEWNGIKNVISAFESNITAAKSGEQITVKDVDIDCHSNLIKITGLILLAFLL